MLRIVIVMALCGLASASGQVMVRHGMQQVGSLETTRLVELLAYFRTALTNWFVLGGTALNGVAFLLVITALSWNNVTVIIPFAALEHVFLAFLAILLLQEVVTPVRWLGIAFVVLGVVLVSWSATPQGSPP